MTFLSEALKVCHRLSFSIDKSVFVVVGLGGKTMTYFETTYTVSTSVWLSEF